VAARLVILRVVSPDSLESYAEASRIFLGQRLEGQEHGDFSVYKVDPRKKEKTVDFALHRRVAESGTCILLCVSHEDVDEELRLLADVIADVPQPTPRQIDATFRRFGHMLTKFEGNVILQESWTRLVFAFQPGRPLATGLRRLCDASRKISASKVKQEPTGPTLADVSGLGPAQKWGLELAEDLAHFKDGKIPWEDVDCGVLVSGLPGTGKTMFAQALALSCGVPIVVASAAQWQAEGYLNDLLKAMRGSFREARDHGISILFIDELDAIGSRAINDSQHADYKRQVINGLLELLDGFSRRKGIVVVGATNYPENIDPAILRPGRLDRHFEIPLPDGRTRREIFRFHAGFPVPAEKEQHFDRATAGMSGAALQQLVRDGKRVARRARKTFAFEHLASVFKLIDLPLEYRRVIAVHEAGHAIIGMSLGMELTEISITDKIVSDRGGSLGTTTFVPPALRMRTRSFYLDRIAMYLGGVAAENLVFGEFSEAASGHAASDLGAATALATKVEACLGMGTSLAIEINHVADLSKLRAKDARLRATVDEVLERQLLRATEILRIRSADLHRLANTLLDTQSLTNEDVQKLFATTRDRRTQPKNDVDDESRTLGKCLDELGFQPLGRRISLLKTSTEAQK
jgi:ATP-dependent Zn protease